MIKVNSIIEHTLLNPKATWKDLRKLCEEAKYHAFRSVCVNPEWVFFCRTKLEGTDVKVVQVYYFPTSKSELLQGDEVDVYINLKGISKNGYTKNVGHLSIQGTIQVIEKAGIARSNIKAIIETRQLSDADVIVASKLCAKERVGYIKSSTGLYKRINGRTNLQDLKLIKKGIGFSVYKPKIKIAGGIKTIKDVNELCSNGADLIGTSKGPDVVNIID